MADISAQRSMLAGEVAPLLPSASPADRPSTQYHRTRCTWPWLRVVALAIALAIVSDIGEDLYAAPKVRLLESAACAEYYTQHDSSLLSSAIPEHLCKLEPIQDRLAGLLGWQLFFDSIPAILFPIPFGYLADQRGRKWILALALTGFTLSYL
jgi:MFS family permease